MFIAVVEARGPLEESSRWWTHYTYRLTAKANASDPVEAD